MAKISITDADIEMGNKIRVKAEELNTLLSKAARDLDIETTIELVKVPAEGNTIDHRRIEVNPAKRKNPKRQAADTLPADSVALPS